MAALGSVVSVASACGQDDSGASSAATASAPRESEPTPTFVAGSGVGDPTGETVAASPVPDTGRLEPSPTIELIDFKAPLVGGGAIDLSTFSGRPIAFWFWAPG